MTRRMLGQREFEPSSLRRPLITILPRPASDNHTDVLAALHPLLTLLPLLINMASAACIFCRIIKGMY